MNAWFCGILIIFCVSCTAPPQPKYVVVSHSTLTPRSISIQFRFMDEHMQDLPTNATVQAKVTLENGSSIYIIDYPLPPNSFSPFLLESAGDPYLAATMEYPLYDITSFPTNVEYTIFTPTASFHGSHNFRWLRNAEGYVSS